MNTNGFGRMFTVDAAAEALGLKPATLRRWILTRRIAYHRIGTRSVRIPESEILRILSADVVPARREAQ